MNDQKIVFLIGAGGSSPFIENLTTQNLTGILFNFCEWEKIISKIKAVKKEQGQENEFDNIEACDIFLALCKIESLLKENLYFKNFDFEHVIHLLDKVSMYYLSQMASEISNIDPIIVNFFTKYQNQYSPYNYFNYKGSYSDGWKYVPVLAREIIIDAILDLWDKSKQEVKDINRNFFCGLSKCFECVNIYSLNYDPLLYESLKDCGFYTGFEGNNNQKDFKREKFMDPEITKTLAFMHGHVGFIPKEQAIIGKIEFCSDYRKAQEQRFKGMFPVGGTPISYSNKGSKGQYYNTYLVTGLDKMDAFSQNPFASYIHRFAVDISEADYIVIIGVSLNDYHLNSFLVNSIAFAGSKIVFVTTKDNLEKLLENNEDNILLYLWSITKDTATIKNDFEQHIKGIIKSGEEFAKLTDHIIVFSKGTKEFYEKYKECDMLEKAISSIGFL